MNPVSTSALRARTRVCVAALALALAFTPDPARAAPSERDLAYEQALAAEEAGDQARAAAAYERAYTLTAPGESGPRLLFLRAGITARLRADGGTGTDRTHLCRARELLRGHLGDAPATTPDPLAEERTRLAEVETRLAGADCSPPAPLEPKPPTITTPTSLEPSPSTTTAVTPTIAPVPPPPRPTKPPTRALWIAGGVGLGLGAAAFALMGTGVASGRRSSADGDIACRHEPNACDSNAETIRDIVAEGRRSEQLVKAGAALGSVAVLAGVTLLALAAHQTRRSVRVALTPRVAPGWLGLGLSTRF